MEGDEDELVFILIPNRADDMKNPIRIGKALDKSPFNKYPDKTTNKTKKLIAIRAKDKRSVLDELAKITKIGDIRVTVHTKSDSDQVRHGVIYPVDKDITCEEVKQYITVKHLSANSSTEHDIQVKSVQRLKRKNGDQWEDSESLKITFSGTVLPHAVLIHDYSHYNVKPFVAAPLQCYNCQRMGHTAKTCKSPARCMYCGGAHEKKDCPKSEENFSCANCSGKHRSNDPSCSYYKEAKQIELIRAKKNNTYNEAKMEIRNKGKVTTEGVRPLPLAQVEAAPSTSKHYSGALLGNLPSPSREADVEHSIPTTQKNETTLQFANIIKACLVEILNSLLPKEILGKTNLNAVVEKTVDKHCSVPSTSAPQTSASSFKSDVPSHNSSKKAESQTGYYNIFSDITASDDETSFIDDAPWEQVGNPHSSNKGKHHSKNPKKRLSTSSSPRGQKSKILKNSDV